METETEYSELVKWKKKLCKLTQELEERLLQRPFQTGTGGMLKLDNPQFVVPTEVPCVVNF